MIDSKIQILNKKTDFSLDSLKSPEKLKPLEKEEAISQKESIKPIDTNDIKKTTLIQEIKSQSDTTIKTEESLISNILNHIFDKKFSVEIQKNEKKEESKPNSQVKDIERKIFEVDLAAYKAEGIITTTNNNNYKFELEYKIINEILENKNTDSEMSLKVSEKVNELHSEVFFKAKEINEDSMNEVTELIGKIKFTHMLNEVNEIQQNEVINKYKSNSFVGQNEIKHINVLLT